MAVLYSQTSTGNWTTYSLNAPNDNYAWSFVAQSSGIPISLSFLIQSVSGTPQFTVRIQANRTLASQNYGIATFNGVTSGVAVPVIGGLPLVAGTRYWFYITRTSSTSNIMQIIGFNGSGSESYYASTGSNIDPTNLLISSADGVSATLLSGPSSLAAGLVGAWNFEGNSNDSVAGNNGTDTAITYSTGNGKILQGAGFNGTSSCINIPSVTSLQIIGALTISTWIKITSLSGGGRILAKSAGNISNYEFEFGYDSSGNLNFTSSNTTNFFNCNSVGSVIGTGTWFHVGVVRTGNSSTDSVYFYINGISVPTVINSNDPSFVGISTIDVTFGKRSSGGSPLFLNGAVDIGLLYNRAISSSEMFKLYNENIGIQYSFSVGTMLGIESISGINNITF